MVEVNPQLKENLKGVKRIIGVYSGKGGVGKTTCAVNIAAFLAQQGYRVGLLDADIDCPNVAHALGLHGTPDLEVLDNRIIPLEKYGMKIMSMASLQESQDEAIVWRGPMVTDMVMQFLGTANWGNLDYLIIDLPPGTSDIPLTIMKFLKPHGIIVVTTPRSIATMDARKSANLAKLTNVSILGVIETMSGGIFGAGKGNECAHEISTLYLGALSFDEAYISSIDEGTPAVLSHPLAQKEIAYIIERVRTAEKLVLGSTLPLPKKNVLHKAKNLALDFKNEIIDRYKGIKKV